MSTPTPYSTELHIALLAVQRATLLTKSVFTHKSKGTLSKSDSSPVTIGDFGAQALVIAALTHAFPQDSVVGEEEASSLRSDPALTAQIWDLVKEVRLEDATAEEALGGPLRGQEEMLAAIDRGTSEGGREGRYWVLDPIDGTKGFLRGGQYAVCLALVVDGDVKVGVLGCPNLAVDVAEADGAGVVEGEGVLISAILGQGAHARPLGKGGLQDAKSIAMRPVTDLTSAVVCESVEPGHSSKGQNLQISQLLGITKPPVQMDSQAKYGSISRGAGDLYLRLPVRKDYEEKIWDHASGDLIVREAGGTVTDVKGKKLDFGLGRTLKNNKGIVAAAKGIHGRVLKAVQEVLGEAS